MSPVSLTASRVIRSVAGTLDTGTAAVLHGHRVGAPDGPPSARCEPGRVDFDSRRVEYRDPETATANVWDGPRLYIRDADEPSGRWVQIPFAAGQAAGHMPYSAPLWLLGAYV